MMHNVSYFVRLAGALGWSVPRTARLTGLFALAGAILLGAAAVQSMDREITPAQATLSSLETRALAVSDLLERAEDVYAEEVAPIERVLLTYRRDDPSLVRRVAVSLVREARAVELPPRLLLAVLLVENPWIDPEARSPVGAQGLMQVMPFHRGQWQPCAPRLDDVEANICHGARIFASYLRSEKGNVDRALLRYNGCVRGTNTPNCHQYPTHVYARAGRASVLAWRGEEQGTMAASR
jgi:soluble lytic murein transglycosylase-like protein